MARALNLGRLGISGTYTATDLWSGTISSVTGTNWTVNLGAAQAKLFRLAATRPTSATLSATLNGMQLTLNWPMDCTGWRLQTQSETLAADNWSDIPGSRQTNTWTVPIDQAGASVFFRLAWP
jgi:hypothetical protein